MGTSKSYISPKSKEWSNAKRAVTTAIKNPNEDKIANVTKNFMIAVKCGNKNSKNTGIYFEEEAFVNIAGSILFFASCVKSGKLEAALSEFGIGHLAKDDGKLILRKLLFIVSKEYSTLGLDTANRAIKTAFRKLKINSVYDFVEIDIIDLIFEMIASFIFIIFMLNYDEHISNKTTINRGITIKEKIEKGFIKRIKRIIQCKEIVEIYLSLDESVNTIRNILQFILNDNE